jgi:SAM-dependent methyltransferase
MSVVGLRLRSVLLPVFVFLGAWLLFTVELMAGRMLLPIYGGAFHVWTTCMMFFQGVLLCGYAYAHLVAPRIGRWHLALAGLPLLALPVSVAGVPVDGAGIAAILRSLLYGTAAPVLLLSTTSVLAQSWFASDEQARGSEPYWLYAASNAGSLLGLLAYPLLLEPFLGLQAQRAVWNVAFVVYGGIGLLLCGTTHHHVRHALGSGPAPSIGRNPLGTWFALAMAPSVMLMAATNAISHEIGSLPLAWMAPLAIYLLTFILAFSNRPSIFGRLQRYWLEIGLVGLAVLSGWLRIPDWPRLLWHLLALFAVALRAHSALYRCRPEASQLTTFYLVLAAGGFAGGMFTCLIAPVAFVRLHEYGVAIVLLLGALAWQHRAVVRQQLQSEQIWFRLAARTPLMGATLALSCLWLLPPGAEGLFLLRNHYGIYKVGDVRVRIGGTGAEHTTPVRQLVHNGTVHGFQALAPELRNIPTGYYHPSSPLGDVFERLPSPRRVAIIGLGTGSTAPYFGPEDELVYYEIDPDGARMARERFSFLADSPAQVRIVIGDARLELAEDPLVPDGHFDAIIVDAFSGDAIPTHLLTREALAGYMEKLREDGLLVLNVTNRFYDLRAVLRTTAASVGLDGAFKSRELRDGLDDLEMRSHWYVLTRDETALARLANAGWIRTAGEQTTTAAWTDDYVNILAPLWAKLAPGD